MSRVTTRIKRRAAGKLGFAVPPLSIEQQARWRLGQRVWFQFVDGGFELTATPHGPRGARRYSSRICREVWTITGNRSR